MGLHDSIIFCQGREHQCRGMEEHYKWDTKRRGHKDKLNTEFIPTRLLIGGKYQRQKTKWPPAVGGNQ